MKTFAMLAAAGLASTAVAQDTVVTIAPAGGTSWTISAEYVGAPLPGALATVWSDANFDLTSTDGVISNVDLNQGFDTSALGAPAIGGEGTGSVSIRATMPAGLLANADLDSSNPLAVGTFDYDGTAAGLSAVMVGQNSLSYSITNFPFSNAFFYQLANGDAGTLSLVFNIVPAPASAALLGLGGLAAVRRRR
ncbi:MAG: PEP-CTERM sorting domain-containing protein [Phycisphaerales bacterium]